MAVYSLSEIGDLYSINYGFLHNSLGKQLKNSSASGLGIVYNNNFYYDIIGTLKKGSETGCDLHTQFPLSSLTKVFTGLLIEMLVETGELTYKDSLGKICPSSVLDNLQIDASITIEMLMSHQSGILNGKVSHYSNVYKKSLDSFVKEDLKKVEYIEAGKGYFFYSDVAINFLGYLCECITKSSFSVLLKSFVLAPLELNDTCFPDEINIRNSCEGVLKTEDGYTNLGYYSDNPSFYPSNQLYSSLYDLNKLMQYCLKNFEKHQCLFEPLTLMGTNQYYCRSWVYERYKSKNIYFHHGADLGVLGRIYLIPSESMGIVLLNNSEPIGYANRIVHYLLNKIHLNSPKDSLIDYQEIETHKKEQCSTGFANRYISVSGKAKELKLEKENQNLVMSVRNMGEDLYDVFQVKYSHKGNQWDVFDEEKKCGQICVIESKLDNANIINYNKSFYVAVLTYEEEEKNIQLYLDNIGKYEGVLEYQSKKEQCDLNFSNKELYAAFQHSVVQIFPHPMIYNTFLSSIGMMTFDIRGGEVIGFTMKKFLKFVKLK